MPIYAYRCDEGHEFEAFQSMSEDPISSCTECGAPARRVLTAPAIHFKGSGFYTTDYARKKGGSGGDGSGKQETSDSTAEKASGEGSSGSPDSKSASESKTAAGSGAD